MVDIRDNDRLTLVLHYLGSRCAVSDGVYTLDKASFQAALDSSPTFREQVLAVYFQRQ
jgi:hypothetical protein